MKVLSVNLIVVSMLMILFSGCDETWIAEEPPHLVTIEATYSDLDGFEAGLNGLYAEVRMEVGDEVMARKGMFMGGTDNLTTNNSSTLGFNLIAQRWGDANNPLESNYTETFSWLYGIVNAANTIVSQAETRTNIDWTGRGFTEEENKNRVIAEAKSIRAWAYRHLTYGWGDVPLNLDVAQGSTIRTDWTRTPVAEVREQIISDLLFAEEYIPTERDWEGRITKGAIQHYLAEMYLVKNKPDSAKFWANIVINTPEYQLITERYGVRSNSEGVPIMDMFQEGNQNRSQGNTEALWVFQFALGAEGGGSSRIRRIHVSRYGDWVIDGVSALQDTYNRGGRGRSRQSLTKWAIDLYEPQDDRASNFAIRKFFIFKDEEDNAPYAADQLPPGYSYGDTLYLDWSIDLTPETSPEPGWPFSRKVEGTDPDDPRSSGQYNNQVYLRLAETYLLKAEAQYLLNDLEGAAETINVIRRRSNASEVSAGDIDIDFILDERSRELVVEEHRRWTLLRTGKWLERTKMYNNNGGQHITERDTIFPIPQDVINTNLTTDMPQNPGF